MLNSGGALERQTTRQRNMGYRVDTKVSSFPSCHLCKHNRPRLEASVLNTTPALAVRARVCSQTARAYDALQKAASLCRPSVDSRWPEAVSQYAVSWKIILCFVCHSHVLFPGFTDVGYSSTEYGADGCWVAHLQDKDKVHPARVL